MSKSTENVDIDSTDKKDVTGRDRLVRNLMARWLGQIVVVISGFVIPRVIDGNLGASALGIWDFAWSTVAYFRFMGLGLASGLNRFVALYNAQEATEDLQRAISSTVVLQLIVASITALAAFVVSYYLPLIFDDIADAQVVQSQYLVIFLGCGLAVRMLFWPARSILTGYHLWTVTSAVTAGGDIVLLVGLFSTLKFGGGLAQLGMVGLAVAIVTEGIRVTMAKRVYKRKLLVWSAVDRPTMKKMIIFGLKNNVTGLPKILAVQTTGLVLAATAGPAALAVYARPLALFHHVERMIKQYAFLLTPMAGSIQGLKHQSELKEFFLSSLRSSFAISIPPLLLLGGYGDIIIDLWMGSDYVVPYLAPTLAAAFIFPFSHSAAMRILVGVNSHGRIGVWSLVATLVALAISVVVASDFGWSAQIGAIVVGISLSAGPGLVVIIGACRRFSVSFKEYWQRVFLHPALCNLPLLGVILISRVADSDMSFLHASGWGLFGALSVVGLYWKFLLSETNRSKIRAKLPGRVSTAASTPD